LKAYVLTFFVALVLGIAGGVALGVFAYPYLFLTDIVANEKVPPQQQAAETQRKVLARGNFVHANPNDPIHYGKGRVTVYEGLLHLDDQLRSQEVLGAAVQVGAEADALLADRTEGREAPDLVAARVGQNGPVPRHEAVESTKVAHDIITWAQVEVIRVREDDTGAGRLEVVGIEGLHRSKGSDGHEHGRVDRAVRSDKLPRACRARARVNRK